MNIGTLDYAIAPTLLLFSRLANDPSGHNAAIKVLGALLDVHTSRDPRNVLLHMLVSAVGLIEDRLLEAHTFEGVIHHLKCYFVNERPSSCNTSSELVQHIDQVVQAESGQISIDHQKLNHLRFNCDQHDVQKQFQQQDVAPPAPPLSGTTKQRPRWAQLRGRDKQDKQPVDKNTKKHREPLAQRRVN